MTASARMEDSRPRARNIYRVHIGAALLMFTAIAAGAWAAFESVTLLPASSHALRDACHSLLPAVGAGEAAALVTIAMGAIVMVRAALSLARQVVRTRRHLSNMERTPGTSVIAGTPCTVFQKETPDAFCAGYLEPSIFISTGALDSLSERELCAVVAHERHHVARRDPLRILVARVASDALPFLPALRHLTQRYEEVAELAADDVAVSSTGSRAPLASALLKMASGPLVARAGTVGIARERVDHMTGDFRVGAINLPASLAVTSAFAAALIGGIATSALIAAGPVNVTLAIAGSCMALMYLLPALAVGAAVAAAVRRSSRRATGRP